ncbi:NACHT domain-containing protein [Streptomyces sp. CC219B]|uniref:NACHT domain-containing protein n=1 Tax=Streptomyces sp. CC219B TaxID=3044574 RepID=UPI0024A931F8|nr:NACHT domain-containing protein [Streptomyces sp. CC219B]
MQAARRGALGGASNEAGASHRAGVAALLAAYGLLGEPVPWLRSDACPVLLRMEADLHVDDVVVDLADGTRAFMQAKLTAGQQTYKDTVDQWCRSVASGECRPGDEVLFVVTRTTTAFQGLADALATRRSGASLTATAAGHLDGLRRLAAGHGLDGEAIERLLDAAVIHVLDARDNAPHEALGAACLNAAVVPSGHGQAAFRAVRAAARAQAEQRTASDLTVWRSWLTRARLPLTADMSGAAAVRLEALEQALCRYREEWAQRQDVLPLADLGLGLTSMTVPGLAKDLRAPAAGQKTGRDHLADTVRRQGRLFLVGRPGAGKTVASRLIAARWAANDRAPVPVWLRLRDLLPALPATGPYRIEASGLVRAAVGEGQPVLSQALQARIEQGRALLLLDALDEVPDRQDAVVEALADLLDRLPSDLDVVVTSRHSCLRSASMLQLAVYELKDPQHLTDTLDQLLRTVAERLCEDPDDAGWMGERRRRIAHSRRAEPDLWRVPLLATLMVLLIAQRPAHTMPTSRAGLLTEVIDSSVRQWEMRRGALTVPDTDPGLTADVLLDCFDDIARLVAADGSTPWQQAHQAVSARLQQHWGKPAGTAAAAARHILEHWDATAGVFISDTPHGTLTARTRLFAEIGEARWAVRTPTALASWMNEVITERPESARLAASLAPQAADALITQATAHGGELLDVVHAALRDGTTFDDTSLHTYRQAQLTRLATVPNRCPPTPPDVVIDLSEGHSPRAELAVRLAGEHLDAAQTGQLAAIAGEMSPRFKTAIAALCMLQQARRRATELTDSELDTLQAALEASASDDAADHPAHSYGADELVRAAVTHLLPRRPQTASALVDAAHWITLDTLEWLETELPELGHAATLKAVKDIGTPPGVLTWLAQSFKGIAAPFELLADMYDTPVTLTPAQAWHMDEAAAFIHAAGTKQFAAMTPSAAAQQQPELTRSILRLALEASGHDGALISAQLRTLREENPERIDWGLLYLPSTRTPSTSFAPTTVDTDLIVKTLQHGNAWLVALALTLASRASAPDKHLADRLSAQLPAFDAATRMRTGMFLAHHWPTHPLPDSDAAVRAGAARARATALTLSRRHREAQELLADPDLLVRAQAARCLKDIPSSEIPLLQQALLAPAQQWTCLDCDTAVPAEADRCDHNHARPTPRFSGQSS